MRRRILLVTAIVGVVAIAIGVVLYLRGRDNTDDLARVARQAAAWRAEEPANYAFTFHFAAMCRRTEVRVEVRGGQTTSTSVVDTTSRVPGCGVDAPTTIEGVFLDLRRATRDADEVTVVYDKTYGFPADVTVDSIANAIDDEYSFGVSDFEPLP